MNSQCSHVLVWVKDLHQAVNHFRQAGFSVHYATAPDKAKHAHIWFQEGPIIELLTTPKNAHWFKWPIDLLAGKGAGARMTRWPLKGEGFCDLAMVTADHTLQVTLHSLRQAGVAMGRPVRWTRTRPDGQKTRFRFVYPRNERLPFLVTPYDPVQHPPQVEHANGALALKRIHFGVRREDESAVSQLMAGDKLCQLHQADETGVLSIELEGLTAPLDPATVTGAIIYPFVASHDHLCGQGKHQASQSIPTLNKDVLC